jgi:hypothetical protein
MTREDSVLLVSRALSLLWGATALVEATYLPERLFAFVHYANRVTEAGGVGADGYLPSLYRLEAGLLFGRVVIYLLLAFVFWRCGPWVVRTLLPVKPEPSAQAPSGGTGED